MEDVLTLLMLYTHRATACECFSVALRRGTFGVYSLRNMTFFIEPLEKKVCLSACGYVVVGGGIEFTLMVSHIVTFHRQSRHLLSQLLFH